MSEHGFLRHVSALRTDRVKALGQLAHQGGQQFDIDICSTSPGNKEHRYRENKVYTPRQPKEKANTVFRQKKKNLSSLISGMNIDNSTNNGKQIIGEMSYAP